MTKIKIFRKRQGSDGDRNLAGVVRARKGQKSQTLVMTGEGEEGTKLFQYGGTEPGDAQVGG